MYKDTFLFHENNQVIKIQSISYLLALQLPKWLVKVDSKDQVPSTI